MATINVETVAIPQNTNQEPKFGTSADILADKYVSGSVPTIGGSTIPVPYKRFDIGLDTP